MKSPGKEIYEVGPYAFMSGSKTAVFMSDTSEMVGDSKTPTEPITVRGTKKEIKFVKRGEHNNLPAEVMEKVYANIAVGSNIEFNSKMAYGDGIMVVKKIRKEGKLVFEEQLASDQPEIFQFLCDNNYVYSVQEWANDLSVFSDSYVEIIFGRGAGNNKIVSILPVESINSRVSVADEKTGKIEYHGYSTKWHERIESENVQVTRLINRHIPLLDLKRKRGIVLNLQGKKETEKDNRYILQLMMPTPARYYYGKPYWWSIFTSKWYDFSCAIPELKAALLKNQMVLKYHVKINNEFWVKLFKDEGITDHKKMKERKTRFLTELDEFLAGEKNAGKSFVSHFKYDRVKGFTEDDVIITPIESFFKGGEYIDDSEEATSVICYAMGVHPSLIGATPGKGKSTNGTEARELFIIKQAMMKPIRNLLLLPLYLAKEMNGWDTDIDFVIPNIMLTTLDKGTGAIKSIGNEKV